MTEISAVSLNDKGQEYEIAIKEFVKAQKQFMENMKLMFQKRFNATSTTQSILFFRCAFFRIPMRFDNVLQQL